MGKLVYIANVSLDGYVEDVHGAFDWSEPSDDVFACITDLLRPIVTHLYGRRMYQTMAVWETDPALGSQSALMTDFADVWQAADKVVYSTTLDEVSTRRTQLERRFDPDAVRNSKEAAAGDVTIGGSNLAAHAFDAGLIDEYEVFVHPVLLGGGKPAFSGLGSVRGELLAERGFANGVVNLRYRILA